MGHAGVEVVEGVLYMRSMPGYLLKQLWVLRDQLPKFESFNSAKNRLLSWPQNHQGNVGRWVI
jgi:hypothetical protein